VFVENQIVFSVEFSPRARNNLTALRKRDQQIIVDAIATQLMYQPDQPTRNRKPLADNPVAPWELRVGDFRVFYDVSPGEERVVVVAVGQKSHNTLRIGGEEIEL
jgi:mRNA-degrading endonuclease RelE of RelBE toxin-antitoxin system